MIKLSKNKLRKNSIALIVMSFLVAVDQIIKYLVELYLMPIGTRMMIPGFIQLHYHKNDGAMMGFLEGQTVLVTVLSVICMIAVVIIMFTDLIKTKLDYVCLVMIATGGIGNIIDRIFRGYVVDYIEYLFIDFYIFNFADCLITVGAFLMIFYQIYLIVKESKDKKGKAENG